MKAAIPLFGERVAPRLECAATLLVAEVDAGKVLERQTYPLSTPSPQLLVQLLASLGVRAAICGGINGFLARHLQAAGIGVLANVMGDAESALEMFASGTLRQGWRQGPGSRRFRRRGPGRRWIGPPFGGIG